MTPIGTCSLCGGCVAEGASDRLVPPVPTCQTCGAVKKNAYGPVVEMTPKPKRPEGYGPAYPMFPKDYIQPRRLTDYTYDNPPAHPHPMDHLRPFPFETLPPIDSIKDAFERERNKSRFIGIGPKLGDTEPFMGGGSMSLGQTSKSSCTHVDDARREDAYNAIKDAFEKFIPGAKGSISVRRINLGD